MTKYVLLSIPIVFGVVVGCIAFAVRLLLLDPPTLEEIRQAPVYTGPGGAVFDFDAWEREWEERNREGDNATVRPKGPTPAQPGKKLGPMDYRQNKEIARRNAFIVARKFGAVTGMIALVLGYAGLGIYLRFLGRKRARPHWRDVVTRPAQDSLADVTSDSTTPYDAADAPQPPADTHEEDAEGPQT